MYRYSVYICHPLVGHVASSNFPNAGHALLVLTAVHQWSGIDL